MSFLAMPVEPQSSMNHGSVGPAKIYFKNTAVILPVFNEEARLGEVLEYYEILQNPIWVIDNNSTDLTVAIAAAYNQRVLSHSNQGTTEDPAWCRWLMSSIQAEYYLFLSCSERISYTALQVLSSKVGEGLVDLVYIPRLSYTGEHRSLIFGSIFSLIGLSRDSTNVCRLVGRKALSESCDEILIHDNFRRSRCKYNWITCSRRDVYIKHLRPLTSYATLLKLLAYAKVEAASRPACFKTSTILCGKILREFIVAFILLFTFRLNLARGRELLARVLYHLSVMLLVDPGVTLSNSCQMSSECAE